MLIVDFGVGEEDGGGRVVVRRVERAVLMDLVSKERVLGRESARGVEREMSSAAARRERVV